MPLVRQHHGHVAPILTFDHSPLRTPLVGHDVSRQELKRVGLMARYPKSSRDDRLVALNRFAVKRACFSHRIEVWYGLGTRADAYYITYHYLHLLIAADASPFPRSAVLSVQWPYARDSTGSWLSVLPSVGMGRQHDV